MGVFFYIYINFWEKGVVQLINANNLVYEVGGRTILNEVSFTVSDGDRIAIVGPNGAGKSTLLKIITGELLQNSGTLTGVKKNPPNFSYMPQHINSISVDSTISVYDFLLSSRGLDKLNLLIEKVQEALEVSTNNTDEIMQLSIEHGDLLEKYFLLGGNVIDGEIASVMDGIGLTNISLDRIVSTLSGGQKTKLAFAKVLLSNKSIMILDEPTNHLDQNALEFVVAHLKRFKGSLIVVSHDVGFNDLLTNKTFDLSFDGRLTVFQGSPSIANGKKDKLQKHRLKLSMKQSKEEKALKDFIERWRGKKANQVRDREKKLARLQQEKIEVSDSGRKINIYFPVKVQSYNSVLSVLKLGKSYGNLALFEGLSFDVERGDKMAVVGANGVGKSTLLKIITGNIKDFEGVFEFGDRVDYGYYAQEHETLNPNNSVLEEMRQATGGDNRLARAILAHFIFTSDMLNTRVNSLSFGEKSRLKIATLVAGGHNLLILDEPTNHLDVLSKERVIAALKVYKGTIIVVSHDQDLMSEIDINKVLLLSEQRIVNI